MSTSKNENEYDIKAGEAVKKLLEITKNYEDKLVARKNALETKMKNDKAYTEKDYDDDHEHKYDKEHCILENNLKIIQNLNDKLSSEWKPECKLQRYYQYLNLDSINGNTKFINIIKRDKKRSTLNFLKGIAIIAATLATGIIQGLLVTAIVYAATGKSPMNLFKSEGSKFTEKTDKIYGEYSKFFENPKKAPNISNDSNSAYDSDDDYDDNNISSSSNK